MLQRPLEAARALLKEGRLRDAAAICRSVQPSSPEYADAMGLLGVVQIQLGEWSEAIESLKLAVRQRPNSAELRNMLGLAFSEAGNVQEAEKAYRRALALRANFVDALNNLGRLLHAAGQAVQAEQALRRALAFQPEYAYAHDSLGMLLVNLGRVEEGKQHLRRAFELNPNLALAHHQRGMSLLALGKADEAERSLLEALALNPKFAPAHIGMAELQCRKGHWQLAEQTYRQAIASDPSLAAAYANLASVLVELGRFEEAEMASRQALERDPTSGQAYGNLGLAFLRQGRIEQAEESSRRAIALAPDLVPPRLNLAKILMQTARLEEAESAFRDITAVDPDRSIACESIAVLQNYIPGRTPAQVFAAHRDWGGRLCATAGQLTHDNSTDPRRRLRIGYVSPDFREHSVAAFVEPVLRSHDKSAFDITCYYNHPSSDAVTERFKQLATSWRDVSSLDDDAMASAIVEDGIDVLIDLAGYTARNRLAVFARRPSPVQITWLGYPTATGCPAIGFRITDPRVDEPSEEEPGIERPMRLEQSYFCFSPPKEQVDPGRHPMESGAGATFGCFNALIKINAVVVALWCRVLAAAPASRLVLKAKGLDDPGVRARMIEWFRQGGIATERVSFMEPQSARAEHLAQYRNVDIALDTYPYNGATTTCEALWMGVPVVSLAGRTHASRMGRSILHAAGLGEFACDDADAFVRLATALAADARQLGMLRESLRRRLASSPLMDAARFTRNLESVYRAQWESWCEGRLSGRV